MWRTLPKRVPAMQTLNGTGGGIAGPRPICREITGHDRSHALARRPARPRCRGAALISGSRPVPSSGTDTPDRSDPPMSIGPAEIVIVLILALLVFGPKRLPQMGKSLGQAACASSRRPPTPPRPSSGWARSPTASTTSSPRSPSPSRRSPARSATSSRAWTSSRPSRRRSRPRAPARPAPRRRPRPRPAAPARHARAPAGQAARRRGRGPGDAGRHAGHGVRRRRRRRRGLRRPARTTAPEAPAGAVRDAAEPVAASAAAPRSPEPMALTAEDRLTLLEHLDELRKRLFVCLIAATVGVLIAALFNSFMFEALLLSAARRSPTCPSRPPRSPPSARPSRSWSASRCGSSAASSWPRR